MSKDISYFPDREIEGGWRLIPTDHSSKMANIDFNFIELEIKRQQLFFGNHPQSIVIIKDGYLVYENHSFMTLQQSRFDIWSCTKSFTGIAWMFLLEEIENNKSSKNLDIKLETPIYNFLPKDFIKNDSRKKNINLHHLLSMTSGLKGENNDIYGLVTGPQNGPFEFAIGKCENRYGKSVDILSSEPGKQWGYSDPAVALLSFVFFEITKKNIHEYLYEKLFRIIGIENASWDIHGGGNFLGPFTSSHVGLHISARDLSRFGYFMLKKGQWNNINILSSDYIDRATTKSQNLNSSYGYQFWINSDGLRWPSLPRDTYALEGYNSNRCYIIPSYDLIITRIGSGPSEWNEQNFVNNIFKSFKKN